MTQITNLRIELNSLDFTLLTELFSASEFLFIQKNILLFEVV